MIKTLLIAIILFVCTYFGKKRRAVYGRTSILLTSRSKWKLVTGHLKVIKITTKISLVGYALKQFLLH